jgi:hypothetical protein
MTKELAPLLRIAKVAPLLAPRPRTGKGTVEAQTPETTGETRRPCAPHHPCPVHRQPTLCRETRASVS